MSNVQGLARRAARLLLATALAGCGPSHDGADGTDTASAAAATADSAGAMAGMQHDSAAPGAELGVASRPAARDSNQSFLRMMADHHEGLIAMTGIARPHLAGARTKRDAEKLAAKQKEEQASMERMLEQHYGERLTPAVLPSNQALADSLRAAPAGAAYDATFYQQVIHHHREGVTMTDRFLPTLTGEVKRMAERMKGEQQQEIREFEIRVGAVARG